MPTPAQVWKRCCRFFERKDVTKKVAALKRSPRTQHADLLTTSHLPLFIVETLATGDELGVGKADHDPFLHNPFETFAGLHGNLAFAMTGDDTRHFVAFATQDGLDVMLVGSVDPSKIGNLGNTRIEAALMLQGEKLRMVAEPGRSPLAPESRDELESLVILMLQCLGTINLPRTTVIERAPEHRVKKVPRMPRLAQRPTYVLLDRREVERRWRASHGEGSIMPHWRRGHWRTLRDPKYGDKVGTRVWVRPTKVGEADVEWMESGRRYLVVG